LIHGIAFAILPKNMRPFFRILLVAALLLNSSISLASAPLCRDLFGPSIDTLLEQAGRLEYELKQTIIKAKRSSDVQNETDRLLQLEELIEEVFVYDDTAEMHAYLSEKLEGLKQSHSTPPVINSSAVVRWTKVVEAKMARKDFEGLQFYLKEKYNKFLDEVSQVHALAELPTSWALERILHLHEVTSEPTYTVRLNRGYRIVFNYEPDKGVHVLRISMKVTH